MSGVVLASRDSPLGSALRAARRCCRFPDLRPAGRAVAADPCGAARLDRARRPPQALGRRALLWQTRAPARRPRSACRKCQLAVGVGRPHLPVGVCALGRRTPEFQPGAGGQGDAGFPGGGAVPADPRFLPLAPRRKAARQAPDPLRGGCRLDHAGGAGGGVPGAVRRGQSGHRLLAVADRPVEAARPHRGVPAHLLGVLARPGLGVPAAAAALFPAPRRRVRRPPALAGRADGAGPEGRRRASRTSSSARRRSCARCSSST